MCTKSVYLAGENITPKLWDQFKKDIKKYDDLEELFFYASAIKNGPLVTLYDSIGSVESDWELDLWATSITYPDKILHIIGKATRPQKLEREGFQFYLAFESSVLDFVLNIVNNGAHEQSFRTILEFLGLYETNKTKEE